MTSVITYVKNNIRNEHHEKEKRTILEQRYFPLHLDEELKIIALTIHVDAQHKNEEMEESEDRIENKPVSLHHRFVG